MTGLIDQNGNPLVASRATEGQYRPGPYFLPISGGWLSAEAGKNWNWWQMGYDIESPGRSAMVEACVSAYAQTVAMCPGDHWLATDNGGRERVTTSDLARILRKPNAYQSISDWLLNMVDALYRYGNAYALVIRNNRFEISEIHQMSDAYISVAETGELFYRLSGNEVIENQLEYDDLVVPSRDVLHLKMNTDGALVGESPLTAASQAMAASNAMMAQQIAYYTNAARPSTVLSTDMPLDADQIKQIRENWNVISQGLNAGGTPVLSNGLKPHRLSGTAEEGQLAEILKLSDQQIALLYRVPLQILGIGGTPFASTEALMQSWLAGGLNFALNHIEEAMGNLFRLKGQPDEYLEFNTRVLLRSSKKEQIDALVRATQGGAMSINEVRADLELPAVEYGDEPRVQQQLVPLSAASTIPAAPGPGAPESAAPQQLPEPAQPDRGMNVDYSLIRRFRAARAARSDISTA
jgi:HK97 family phage portal protein